MADDGNDDENVIETEEGSAGGPQTHDPTGTRLRAETPGMLSPKELDRRQRRIRARRKTGGPNVTRKRAGGAARADEQGADVPSTETEEPPGPPPPSA